MGGGEVGAVGEGDCGVRVLVVLGGKGRWNAGLRQIFPLVVDPFHAHARKEGPKWKHGRGGTWYVPWLMRVVGIWWEREVECRTETNIPAGITISHPRSQGSRWRHGWCGSGYVVWLMRVVV